MRARKLLGSIVIAGGIGILLAGFWLMRPHAITYRGDAGTCGYRASYSEPGGARHEETHRRPFELEVTLRHGEVANLVVTPEPGCDARAHCAIVEDGAEVSEANGWAGATCSASTAR